MKFTLLLFAILIGFMASGAQAGVLDQGQSGLTTGSVQSPTDMDHPVSPASSSHHHRHRVHVHYYHIYRPHSPFHNPVHLHDWR
jgi:hypothetical protein